MNISPSPLRNEKECRSALEFEGVVEAQATIHQLPGGQQRGHTLLQGRMLLYLSQPLRL